MMREIKFRAWDKNRKRMYLGDEINSIHHSGIIQVVTQEYETMVMPEDIELMQYTGLHDKNGKEIYEGDILSNWYFGEERALVIFHCGAFKAEPCCFSGGAEFTRYPQQVKDDMTDCLARYIVKYNGSEVIGNVYENPDLLETNDS